jgi:hypothetical protein
VYVNLLANSITGAVLGASSQIFMPDGAFHLVATFFPDECGCEFGNDILVSPRGGSTREQCAVGRGRRAFQLLWGVHGLPME